MSAPENIGVILHKIYPANARVTGKERGEWMKLTDEEAKIIHAHRAQMSGLSRASQPPEFARASRANRRRKPKSQDKLATGAQLWRLNEQGLLRLDMPAERIAPGAELGPPLTSKQVYEAQDRVLAERWHGLGHWPSKGEAWIVEAGRVLLLAAPYVQQTEE